LPPILFDRDRDSRQSLGWIQMIDYRTSHMLPNKGASYDATFQNLPYRKLVWEWEKDILREAVNAIRREKKSIKYLDFACGTGRILGFLEDKVDTSFGVDVSPEMLEVARQKSGKATLILGDLTQQTLFDQGSFDLVTAFRFFLNAEPTLKEDALRAIHQALRDDGYLIFNIHMNKGCLLERILWAYGRIRRTRNENFAALSIRDIQSLAAGANFEIIALHHYGVLPIYYENQRFLIKLIDLTERLFARISVFRFWSRYVIYICRKKIPV
jgi:SAM-dependent methyltransferase